mmetsp:Transcript_1087/g.2472  ORF Transcript_1087/g.2472 Transcript_1087/m.2472 type:complete len:253 (+) Transcript_1087:1086-1844(+)
MFRHPEEEIKGRVSIGSASLDVRAIFDEQVDNMEIARPRSHVEYSHASHNTDLGVRPSLQELLHNRRRFLHYGPAECSVAIGILCIDILFLRRREDVVELVHLILHDGLNEFRSAASCACHALTKFCSAFLKHVDSLLAHDFGHHTLPLLSHGWVLHILGQCARTVNGHVLHHGLNVRVPLRNLLHLFADFRAHKRLGHFLKALHHVWIFKQLFRAINDLIGHAHLLEGSPSLGVIESCRWICWEISRPEGP